MEEIRTVGESRTRPAADSCQVVNNLTRLLQDRGELKKQVAHCYTQVASAEQLSPAGLRYMLQLLTTSLGLPDDALRIATGLEEEFECFDFDGSGALSLHEAYKLVKFRLLEQREQLSGAVHEVNIPVPKGCKYHVSALCIHNFIYIYIHIYIHTYIHV